MSLAKSLTALGHNDSKIIIRDSFLLTMAAYLMGVMVVLRYLLPWLSERLASAETVAIVLPDYYPAMVAYMAVFNGAMLGGMIAGFLLLEERESGTTRALLVTPLPVPTYLLYKVIVPTVFGFAVVLAQLLILRPLAPLPVWQLAAIAVGSAFTAPIVALFFASFAQNRVQGFALMKITGIAGFLIVGAWFVDVPLQYLFGLFPPYWVSKAYWLVLDGVGWWPWALLLGIVLQMGLSFLLMRYFRHVIYHEA